MNVQLFNFNAAGSSVRESSLAQSNEHLECSSEPPGSSSSAMVCILWNKGRCTAPFTPRRYEHYCSGCSGSHWATACSSRSSRDSRDDRKRQESSPGLSSGAKARRSKGTLKFRRLLRHLARAFDVQFLLLRLNVVTFLFFVHVSFVTLVALLFVLSPLVQLSALVDLFTMIWFFQD